MTVLPKSKINILLLAVFVVTIALGGFIFVLLQKNQNAFRNTMIANQVMITLFERRLLAEEYAYTQSDRAKSQWLSKHRDLSVLFDEDGRFFKNSKERELIMQIEESTLEAEMIFKDLTTLYKTRATEGTVSFLDDQISIFSNQLSVKAQEALSAVSILHNMNAEAATSTFHRIIVLFCIAGGIFLAMLAAGFIQIWASTRTLFREKSESQAMLNGIGDGVVAIDLAWNITLWNKAATHITGWTKKEAIGKNFQQIVSFIREHDRSPNIQFIADAMATGEARRMEDGVVLVKKDKTEIPVGDSAAPIFDGDGKILGCIIIFRDITKELENRGLKSDFAYASHQMRTPVNKALWSLESALRRDQPEKIEEDVKNAYRSVESVHKLVSKLLEVSNIDQGVLMVKKKNVVLNELVNEVILGMKKEIATQGVSVRFNSNGNELQLSTDPVLFKGMLCEVLDNAVQYAGGEKVVGITACPRENGILLEVHNDGVDIPEEQLSLVFTKFFRGNNVNSTTSAGAGLGLYIARGYIKLLGGKIWFTSEKGKGTTFFVLLPMG